jgi:hypothetical protein
MEMMKPMQGGMQQSGEDSAAMMSMLGGFTLLRLLNMAGGMFGLDMTKEGLLALNAKLNTMKMA